MKNPYAISNSIYLRAPVKEDVDGRWHEWFSDYEVTKYLADRWWPNSVESQETFFSEINNSKNRLVLCICDKKTDDHIGVCNLSSINWVHRYADIAIIIGESKYKNGIYALEAYDLLINIAFKRLNLRNLRSYYASTQKGSEKINRTFGFKNIGAFKNCFFDGIKYVDINIDQLSYKSKDWKNNKLLKWLENHKK